MVFSNGFSLLCFLVYVFAPILQGGLQGPREARQGRAAVRAVAREDQTPQGRLKMIVGIVWLS